MWKRKPIDEDDEGGFQLQIAPVVAEERSVKIVSQPPLKAQEVQFNIKDFQVAQSFYESGKIHHSEKVTKQKRIPISNPGSYHTSGLWAPDEFEAIEPDVSPYVATTTQVTTIEALPLAESVSAPFSFKSERFGTKLADYQGRSFTDERRWPPTLSYSERSDDVMEDHDGDELDPEVQAYLGLSNIKPKRAKKTSAKLPKQSSSPSEKEYIGHTMGISKVRAHGLLALTSSFDGQVLIWDTSLASDITNAIEIGLADERGAIQSYFGHDGRPVKDVCFPHTHAKKFASGGLDGFACLWDTETGQLLSRFQDTSLPSLASGVNAVAFKPDDEFQLLVACTDRRLRHWDVREALSSKPSQTYDFHQTAVNSASFCEHGRKFVSTGDDRKLLVWDWGVPAPVKIIAEVHLPSMPTTAVHPSTMTFLSMGSDNRMFQFKINASTGQVKKAGEASLETFRLNGGCEPDFSHCGKYLACGDSQGDVGIFSSSKLFRGGGSSGALAHRIANAHASNTPVSSVRFHPCFDGILLSGGWDGKLKWWS